MAGLVVDVVIVGGALLVPLTALSSAGHEIVAAAVGVATGVGYLGGLVAWRGQTIGHAVAGIAVVGANGSERIGTGRAMARGLIVVELLSAVTILLSPIVLLDLVSVAGRRQSFADRLLGTAVMTT